MRAPTPYVGRFAPSPTGPLHFGSLLAAVASYLDARKNAGQWLVRIEDVDPPREQAGAGEQILVALERYGFEWDGPVVFQSGSDSQHREALKSLADAGYTYPCSCSRRDLATIEHGPLGTIYPGTCRTGSRAGDTATRVRTNHESIGFDDLLQGKQKQDLESESGDFVVWRRDGLVAYHLAVVVDDHLQGITHIVRGIDLMDSSPRQIWLQQLLQFRTPSYAHIPVAVHPDGDKLSKLTGAVEIPMSGISRVLVAALGTLQQGPPASLADEPVDVVWNWALENWRLDGLRGLTQIQADLPSMADAKNPLE